eukprot:gene18118-27904_t
MSLGSLRIVGLLLAVAATNAALIELQSETFSQHLKHTKVLAVFYHVPWCSFCKQWSPEFNRAATELKALEPSVKVGTVDASKQSDLAEQMKVTSYPSVRLYLDGNWHSEVEFTGERSAEALVELVRRLATKSAATEISHLQTLHKEIESVSKEPPSLAVVGCFRPQDSSERSAFDRVAQKNRAVYTFIVADVALCEAEQLALPAVYAVGDSRVPYAGDFSDADINAFLKEASYPVLGEMKPGLVFEHYAKRGKPIAWLFVSPDDVASKDEAKSLAKEYKDLSFVWIDGVKYSPMRASLGLSQTGPLPAFAIEDGQKHYAYTGKLANLGPWLKQYVADSLTPTIRSDPAPKDTKKGIVTLVGSTFASAVTSAKEDVFVFLHAPWCSHCQAFMPAFASLGEQLLDEPVTLAMMDATSNDVPEQYDQ